MVKQARSPAIVKPCGSTIDIMRRAINAAKAGNRDKVEAAKRLNKYFGEE